MHIPIAHDLRWLLVIVRSHWQSREIAGRVVAGPGGGSRLTEIRQAELAPRAGPGFDNRTHSSFYADMTDNDVPEVIVSTQLRGWTCARRMWAWFYIKTIPLQAVSALKSQWQLSLRGVLSPAGPGGESLGSSITSLAGSEPYHSGLGGGRVNMDLRQSSDL